MRVRKHGGSQHHLLGIRPDVRTGQGEGPETAVEVLRQK